MRGLGLPTLVFLVFSLTAWSTFAAPKIPKIESLNGSVELNKKVLSQPKRLRAGDRLTTRRDAGALVRFPGAFVQLGPYSQLQVQRTGKKKRRSWRGRLKQGDAEIVVPEKQEFVLLFPRGQIRSQNGTALISIASTQEEYQGRIARSKLNPRPSGGTDFIQISCVEGSIEVRSAKGESVILVPGESVRLQKGKSEFSPLQVGVGQLKITRERLGLSRN